MAVKIFFACFCRVLKCGPQTTKWKNESLKMRSIVFRFEKNVWNSACITTIFKKSLESSRNDSVTNCCKEESCKTSNYFLFTLPLAILFLFSMLVSRTTYCGETDENIEQTPKAQQKTYHFIVCTGSKPRSARQRLKRPGLNFANVAYFLQTKTKKTKHLHRLNHTFSARTTTTQRILAEKW